MKLFRARENSRPRTRTAVLGLAIAALLVPLAAAPAQAAGSFSIKATPYQCTQVDFGGASLREGTTARAYSYHTNMICTPNSGIEVRARVSAGGYSTPIYNGVKNVNAYLHNSSGTPTGWHQLWQWRHQSNTWTRTT